MGNFNARALENTWVPCWGFSSDGVGSGSSLPQSFGVLGIRPVSYLSAVIFKSSLQIPHRLDPWTQQPTSSSIPSPFPPLSLCSQNSLELVAKNDTCRTGMGVGVHGGMQLMGYQCSEAHTFLRIYYPGVPRSWDLWGKWGARPGVGYIPYPG